jgi:hypothetical protein
MNLLVFAVLVEIGIVFGGEKGPIRLIAPEVLGQGEVLGMFGARRTGDAQGLERRGLA